MKSALLITGVSSGIGLGMAKRFLTRGFRVFGSVRTDESAHALQASLGSAFHPLVFDICDAEALQRAEQTLARALEGQPLVALINNAGAAEIGPLLHVPLDSVRRQLDTLVVGQLAVIQRFHRFLLPAGGSQRPGRIINISSVSGQNANPFFGIYSAGKHALEGLSKTLREELRDTGVHVVVVAPGNVATSIWPKQTRDVIEPYRQTAYYHPLQRALDHIGRTVIKESMSVEEFSEALFEIVVTKDPAPRYTVVKRRSLRNPLAGRRVRVTEG